jgi:oxygen-independent coproporphyrinogen-3 oxidase
MALPSQVAVPVVWHRKVDNGLAQGLTSLPPLALYVHLPWCLRKCPYCDFNSHEVSATGLDFSTQQAYVDALLFDLESALPLIWGRSVYSVFMGGGTPSLFSPVEIDRLLAGIRARLRLQPQAEITLEANPGTFERERFKQYAAAGVTRLSVGVQSFQDDALERIGRVHSGQQAREAVAEAAQTFDTWNIDLMYALPGQTVAGLQADLAAALAFGPPHLSIYHLTLEPNTLFARQPPLHMPDEDTAYDMLDLIAEQVQAVGLQRYEVSAFARQGHGCAHNLNYWQFGDYLGIGAGAHSKLSFHDRIERQVRWREPQQYLRQAQQGKAVSNSHVLTADALPFEFMLNALRLTDGFSTTDWVERTGLSLQVIAPILAQAEAKGLLQQLGGRIKPTAKGLDFLSDLQAMFLQDA